MWLIVINSKPGTTHDDLWIYCRNDADVRECFYEVGRLAATDQKRSVVLAGSRKVAVDGLPRLEVAPGCDRQQKGADDQQYVHQVNQHILVKERRANDRDLT